MSHYVVTGSEGFIGKNLCKKLQERGHTISPYDTKIGKDLFGVTPEVLDLADGIFHLACVNQEAAELEKLKNVTVNTYAAQFLADKAKLHNIPLVYTSTSSVYGDAREIPTMVGATLAPLTAYAVAKLNGETFIRLSGCTYKIFRLSNVYGPHQTSENPYCGVIGKFCEDFLARREMTVIEPGTQTRDFTFVDDVLEALIGPSLGWNNTYNVGTGKETSILDLVAVIGGRKRFIPPRSVDTIKRRCLVSDFPCHTPLGVGINKTLYWMQNGADE